MLIAIVPRAFSATPAPELPLVRYGSLFGFREINRKRRGRIRIKSKYWVLCVSLVNCSSITDIFELFIVNLNAIFDCVYRILTAVCKVLFDGLNLGIMHAGVIAATFVCPLDVIKTRFQVHGLSALGNGSIKGMELKLFIDLFLIVCLLNSGSFWNLIWARANQ